MAGHRLPTSHDKLPLLAWALATSIVMLIAAPAWAHEGHEHAEESEGLSGFINPGLLGFSGLHELANIHPVFVHLPLALFPSALLLYGLGLLLKRPSLIVAGRACLYLAAAGTVVTILTGLQAEGTFPHNARVHLMMETHEHLGLTVGVLAVVLVLWSFWQRAQQPRGAYGFLALLAVTTCVAMQNGDLGARMVYVEGAGVNAAVLNPAIPRPLEDSP